MSRHHPLYGKILKNLLAQDQRDILPPPQRRMAALTAFLDEDHEDRSDVIEVPRDTLNPAEPAPPQPEEEP